MDPCFKLASDSKIFTVETRSGSPYSDVGLGIFLIGATVLSE